MSRRTRLEIAKGTYYVLQLASAGELLFAQSHDYVLFESLLIRALRRTEARALAFCWLPRSVHLAVQVGRTPLGRLMQGFTSSYARAVHAQRRLTGHLFAHRYRAILIDPAEWLLPLVRHIHHQPVLEGLTTDANEWPHSSHAAYLGLRHIPWLYTQSVTQQLEARGEREHAYPQLMSEPPDARELERLVAGSTDDPRILGGEAFIRSLPHGRRRPKTRSSVEQIINMISGFLEVPRSELLSSSRKRKAALARAVVAWYATETGAATLTQAARSLGRDPSTLSLAIERHRLRRPDLFSLATYRYLRPLA